MKGYKGIALLLAAVMCVTAIPCDAFAQENSQAVESAQDAQAEDASLSTDTQTTEQASETESASAMDEAQAKETETSSDDTQTAEETETEDEAREMEETGMDPGWYRLGNGGGSLSTLAVSSPTFSDYAQPSKYSGCTIQKGIDVSKYQGTIDWTKVKNAGIQFAFIRVAYRGYGSSGTLAEDSYYKQNLSGAIAAGIPVGVYIFSQATTVSEAEAEADYILARIKGYSISLPVVIDYEFAYYESGKDGRLAAKKLSKSEGTSICNAFCTKVKNAGYTPMIYADKNMLTNYLNASELNSSVWLAHYTSNYAATNYSGNFDYWQFTSSGSVSGISGNVDLNFGYVSAGSAVTGTTSTGSGTTSTGSSTTSKSSTAWTVTAMSGTGKTNGTSIIVRKGPGTSYGKLTKLDINKSVTLTGKTGSWYQVSVKVSGKTKTGYIKKTYITQIAKAAIKSATAKSKSKIRLTWSKVSGASGYQIQRKTAGGSYKTIKTITKGSTTSYSNSGLKKNKKYTYRVRAYKKVRGRKIYGSYSSAKSVKTKKK